MRFEPMTKEQAFKCAEKFLLMNYGEENLEYCALAMTKCAERDAEWVCRALERFIDFEKEIVDALKEK